MNEKYIVDPSASESVDSIVIAHCIDAASVATNVSVDGQMHRLHGKRVTMLDIGTPLVELLTYESTPQNTEIAKDARQNFQVAAEKLVSEGKPFCTALRRMWNAPNFLWEIA